MFFGQWIFFNRQKWKKTHSKWNKKKVQERQNGKKSSKNEEQWACSFIYFNKNSMMWKRTVFATELHCTFACVPVCVFEPNGSHLFIPCSIHVLFREHTKTKQKKRAIANTFQKEEASNLLFVPLVSSARD